MGEFLCRVATPTGDVFERAYVAEDEAALRRQLETQDLMILDVRRRNPLLRELGQTFRLRGRISAAEFLIFNREFIALLKAGLPVVQSLELLLERRPNATFKQSLIDVRERVKSGEALSEAFAAQGPLFPALYSTSLASGERSGELVSVLKRFIDYTQRVLSIRRKVVSALIYPLILLTLAILLIALMVFFIIPKFNEFLVDFGADLPLITKVLVGTAMFCRNNWMLLVGLLVAAVVATLAWNRTERGKLVLDRVKLRLPLVGKIIRNYAQNRFTRTLATLQAGGIPLVNSLELAARAVGNRVFERALLDVAGRVREGGALWVGLDETGLLSDIVVQMIKVGESTGALVEMLTDAAEFIDEEIDTQLTRLVGLIEPLMLLFMAVVVGTMLLSMYLPLLEAYGKAQA